MRLVYQSRFCHIVNKIDYFKFLHNYSILQVILTTLLKVYVKGGLFEKSRVLLNELDAAGFAADEVLKITNIFFLFHVSPQAYST